MSTLIAAIATAAVPSAIGILRLSGPGAVEAVAQVFRPASGRSFVHVSDRTLNYGTLFDRTGHPIDRCLATCTHGPNSYTGEDTAELQCHGSPAVLALGLEALYGVGAQPAPPGEFTRRAFLNGRLDLTQSEAVADLLAAESPAAVHTAAGQLEGVLSQRVESVYSLLTDLMAHFDVVLDWPDEDLDPFRTEELTQGLTEAAADLRSLLDTYSRGRFLAQGIPCVLLGRTNAGKSSLLNALLGYERAIVSDVPGTTRDTVEETVHLAELCLRLVDTAGLRETGDAVERMGVARSRAAAEQAELALLVLDGSRPLDQEDDQAMTVAAGVPQRILVRSKSDLPQVKWDSLPPEWEEAISISVRTGAGLTALSEAVRGLFPVNGGAEAMLTNARQAEAAERAYTAVEAARTGLDVGITPDAVLTDVEGAMSALAELTGRSVQEDVVQRIFSRFCVGK